VRVTRHNRLTGFRPGDGGNILIGPEEVAESSLRYYFVVVEGIPNRLPAVFAEDEIESDVGTHCLIFFNGEGMH